VKERGINENENLRKKKDRMNERRKDMKDNMRNERRIKNTGEDK